VPSLSTIHGKSSLSGMTEPPGAGHIQARTFRGARLPTKSGTLGPTEDLKKLYESKGIAGKDEVIAYCRIGERSSHTWFVLKYLLGFNQVRNYDGSWTEWATSSARLSSTKPVPHSPLAATAR